MYTLKEHESIFCAEHRDEFNNTHRADHSSYPDRSMHEHACDMLNIYCMCNATGHTVPQGFIHGTISVHKMGYQFK